MRGGEPCPSAERNGQARARVWQAGWVADVPGPTRRRGGRLASRLAPRAPTSAAHRTRRRPARQRHRTPSRRWPQRRTRRHGAQRRQRHRDRDGGHLLWHRARTIYVQRRPAVARRALGLLAARRPAESYHAPDQNPAGQRHGPQPAHQRGAHRPTEPGSLGMAQPRHRSGNGRRTTHPKTAPQTTHPKTAQRTTEQEGARRSTAARRATVRMDRTTAFRTTASAADRSVAWSAAVARSCQRAAELVPQQAAASPILALPQATAAPSRGRPS